jgi:ankyrin repeat protein
MENRLKKLKISQLKKVYSKMVKKKHIKIKKKDMINCLLRPLRMKYNMKGTKNSEELSSDLMGIISKNTKNLKNLAVTSKGINQDVQPELNKRLKEQYGKLSMMKKYKKFKIIPYLISSQNFKDVNVILDKFAKHSDLLGYDISDLNVKDINHDDHTRILRTPLMYAILRGEEEIIQKLIRLGADINETDEIRNGRTRRENSMFYLIRSDRRFSDKKKLELLKYFVENGGNIFTQNANGATLLMVAITNKCGKDIIKFLIHKGIDVNETNDRGLTPLIAAILYKNDFEIIKTLVENGADVNARMINGMTPLKWAIDKKEFETVKYLVENGAEIEDISYDQGNNNNNIDTNEDIENLNKIRKYLRDRKNDK